MNQDGQPSVEVLSDLNILQLNNIFHTSFFFAASRQVPFNYTSLWDPDPQAQTYADPCGSGLETLLTYHMIIMFSNSNFPKP